MIFYHFTPYGTREKFAFWVYKNQNLHDLNFRAHAGYDGEKYAVLA
jgi:hypothetical protein